MACGIELRLCGWDCCVLQLKTSAACHNMVSNVATSPPKQNNVLSNLRKILAHVKSDKGLLDNDSRTLLH